MSQKDQYEMQDPRKQYPKMDIPFQIQPEPGLDAKLQPPADHGQATYRGSGRLKGRKASIINTASIQAYDPSPGLLDYALTKGAIVTFTKGLSQQLAPKGIRVNAVAPGPIWTPLQPSYGQPKEKLVEFGRQSPLGRADQPAELAPAYVFLASGESSYVTGEILGVTGGGLLP